MNTSCLVPRQGSEREGPGAGALHLRGGMRRPARTFRALFCEAYQCDPQHFERELFRRSLHWHARPLRGILQRLNRDFFREDDGLVIEVATTASHREVLTELNRFYGRNVRDRNWLRKRFSLRISGKRVLRMSRQLFKGQESDERWI